jgi:hypothetical protein
MEEQKHERLDQLNTQNMQTLKLLGKRSHAIDGYARAGKSTKAIR